MTAEPMRAYDSRMEAALEEMRSLIRGHYPSATFDTGPSQDDAGIVHLYAYVDIADTDEVMDLVIGRMVDMQAEDGLPIFVIPLRTQARAAAHRQAYMHRDATPQRP